ncbi:MAG: hypothetical protein AB7V16_13230 [Vulcanibacillus sp.]
MDWLLILYIYLGLAITWSIYLLFTDAQKYLNNMTHDVKTATFMVFFYLINFVSGVLLFPLSFYNKIIKKRGKL